MKLKRNFGKKKQNNLVIFGVLVTTLLAVLVVNGGVFLSPRPAIIKWEKKEDKKEPENQKLLETKQAVLDLTKDLRGTYGVYMEDLETGESFGINEDEVMTAASLIKLPVFAAVYREIERGNLSLETEYQLQAIDKVAGAGSMYSQPVGKTYTYEAMLYLMGRQSDNTAFRAFSNLLGAREIQQTIDLLGMNDTSLAENETTPRDIGKFFSKLYQGDLVNQENREKFFDHLSKTIWEDRIPAGIPEGIRVIHKVGTEMGVISDAGVILGEKPFVLVIMSEGVNESEAKEVLPEIAELIYTDLETDFH